MSRLSRKSQRFVLVMLMAMVVLVQGGLAAHWTAANAPARPIAGPLVDCENDTCG